MSVNLSNRYYEIEFDYMFAHYLFGGKYLLEYNHEFIIDSLIIKITDLEIESYIEIIDTNSNFHFESDITWSYGNGIVVLKPYELHKYDESIFQCFENYRKLFISINLHFLINFPIIKEFCHDVHIRINANLVQNYITCSLLKIILNGDYSCIKFINSNYLHLTNCDYELINNCNQSVIYLFSCNSINETFSQVSKTFRNLEALDIIQRFYLSSSFSCNENRRNYPTHDANIVSELDAIYYASKSSTKILSAQ
jgi:hypothetical protein